MRLSAIDCVGRGVANLRANWELALLQLVQSAVCGFLAVLGLVSLALLVGATFLLEVGNTRDLAGLMERLQGLTLNGGLLAIALAAAAIVATVVGLVYCWFQAGIVTTLERGERQAPAMRPPQPVPFRTFSGRHFMGWSHRGAWRFFGLLCLVAASAVAVTVAYVVVVGIALAAFDDGGGAGAALGGCLAFLPLAVIGLLLNLWFLVSMTLLARDGMSVFAAARWGLTVLGRRLGGLLLVVVLFLIASLAVGLVFVPLIGGMSQALAGSGVAWFAVQFLLTLAQWLINAILAVALFASTAAVVRGEADAMALARSAG